MKTLTLILIGMLIASCTDDPQLQAKTAEEISADSISSPTIILIGDSMVLLNNDTFLSMTNVRDIKSKQERKPTALTDDNRVRVVKTALAQKIKRESGGVITLTSFKKTNGRESGLPGHFTMYNMEWEATVNISHDIWKSGNGFEGYWSSFRVFTKPQRNYGYTSKQFAAGIKTIAGECSIQKTDSGWEVVGFSNIH